jgi:hypothetical protein
MIESMVRLLVTFLSITSLLICVAASAVWVRSCFIGDGLRWWVELPGNGGEVLREERSAYTARGHFAFTHTSRHPMTDNRATAALKAQPSLAGGPRVWSWKHQPALWNAPQDSFPRWLGFGAATVSRPALNHFALWLPLWAIVLATGAWPAYFFVKLNCAYRRRCREISGRCVTCGYDLRASGDRCPECGALRANIDPRKIERVNLRPALNQSAKQSE